MEIKGQTSSEPGIPPSATTDVTVAKQAKATEQENAQRLSLALAAADLGDWEWDPESDLMTLSRRAAEIYGVSPDRPITRTQMRDLLLPEYREAAKKASQEAMLKHGDYDIEYQVNAPDGRELWVAAKGRGVYDGAGNLVRVFGVVQDITQRKQVERERERLLDAERNARTEAERANRMKDDFLATLSHELRTPLNAIVGWSQILRAAPANPADLAEGLDTIERNARAQTQIIEDLLDMSRIVSGKIRLDVQRLDLAEVIKMSVDTVRPAADAKGIRITLVLDPLAAQVMGDPNRLQQVLWNILNNAVKLTPKGGSIHVTLERINSHAEVSVRDTGSGIHGDFLPYVFDRFRQADSSITRKHGGLGLGLAIVKQLVELHGGTVKARSAGAGHGTTFAIALPLVVVHPEPSPSADRSHPRGHQDAPALDDHCLRLSGAKILIVDDEPDARALLKRLLEDCEATVKTASSAAEGMALLRDEPFDVLVSDVGMPHEDGYAFIQKVRTLDRARGGTIPALALTAYARTEDRMRAIRAGFQMHVVKPVEPAELITMVASLYRHKAS